jgi:cell division septum initiation protein DivIVA
LVEAERKSNAMIADAEAKSTQILAEAIERARQLAGETEDLKKKTRTKVSLAWLSAEVIIISDSLLALDFTLSAVSCATIIDCNTSMN